MYQLSGGGYGGNSDHDGLANGCSTIGISKAPPVEIMEQKFPVLYHHYALHEGSGGAGKQRGGFGLDYKLEILCNNAQASFVMDHGRYGPQGVMGGTDGQVNVVNVEQSKKVYTPIHLSKEQDIQLAKGDTVHVKTPGGGGYGSPFERNESLVLQDVKEEKYSIKQAIELFGVSINENDMEINKKETKLLRRNKKII
jgi:N-methylhydantoinase B